MNIVLNDGFLLTTILSFLDLTDIIKCCTVCKKWYHSTNNTQYDRILWRHQLSNIFTAEQPWKTVNPKLADKFKKFWDEIPPPVYFREGNLFLIIHTLNWLLLKAVIFQKQILNAISCSNKAWSTLGSISTTMITSDLAAVDANHIPCPFIKAYFQDDMSNTTNNLYESFSYIFSNLSDIMYTYENFKASLFYPKVLNKFRK